MDMDGLFFSNLFMKQHICQLYALQDTYCLRKFQKYVHACLCTFSWIIIQVSSLEFILKKSFLVIVSVRKEWQQQNNEKVTNAARLSNNREAF